MKATTFHGAGRGHRGYFNIKRIKGVKREAYPPSSLATRGQGGGEGKIRISEDKKAKR